MASDEDWEKETEELLRDPLVQGTIERALAPYVGVAPPDMLRAMRLTLEDAMTTTPYALGILRALQARRAAREVSGEVRRAGAPPEEAPNGSAAGGGGRREGA
jgi:hypothetical protein